MEETETHNLEKLLDEFGCLPKIVLESTYLEICKYPASRFEEICSRILSFYFNPTNEHGFNDLLIESLFEIIAPDKDIYYINNQVEVISELNSEGKRLDILIKSPDFVIGIENKIDASVYNPLDIYSRQIDLYSKSNSFKVVLSVRKVTSRDEKERIKENGFIIVYYSDFFEMIKLKIGKYISQANQKYLIYLYDFIQTIENMTGQTFDNNKLSQFFSSNSESIENMIDLYNKYKQRILSVQQNRISELIQKIKTVTSDNDWWAFQGWDLGYNKFNKNTDNPTLGLESSYKARRNNPLGEFRIYITTWAIKDFTLYEEILINKFPNNYLDKTTDNRVYLHMDIIENDNEELILQKLKEYYDFLYCIMKKINL